MILPLKALGEKPSASSKHLAAQPSVFLGGLMPLLQSLPLHGALCSPCVSACPCGPSPLFVSPCYEETNQFNPVSLQPNLLTAKDSAGVPSFNAPCFLSLSYPFPRVRMCRSYVTSWSCAIVAFPSLLLHPGILFCSCLRLCSFIKIC